MKIKNLIVGIIIALFLFMLFITLDYKNPAIIGGEEKNAGNIDLFSNANKEEILHYGEMPITYYFKEECIGPIIPRVKKAFDWISNDTDNILTFLEINNENDANIVVNCYRDKIVNDGSITLGEGGYTSLDLYSKYLILKSELHFYSVTNTSASQSCFDIPSVEIHEIFHALGIDHHEGAEDIMSKQFDYFTCRSVKKINDKYVECLKSIYSSNTIECEGVNFMYPQTKCENGWFLVEDSNACCPEPNMKIKNGYCFN